MHGLSTVNFSTFFEYRPTTHERTRGHPLKLNKNRARTDLRQHFFSERVINTWNKLDSDIVCSSSLNMFKNHLERLRKDESFIGLFRSAWLRRPSQSPGEASSGKLCPDICRHATFHPNPCTHFWVILLTDRQTDKRGQTHLPPPLSEVIKRKGKDVEEWLELRLQRK